MDARFHPPMQAAWRGRLRDFERILDAQPELVTSRSSCSHPTLLQFVVLDGGTGKIDEAASFATALIDRGAALEESLVAAASVGAQDMASLLLDAGAPIEACAPWTPLEEAVYWAHHELKGYLRQQGGRVPSLRCAAGLDDVEVVRGFLEAEGPIPGAGPVRFPWGTPSEDPRDVLDQALAIAAKNGSSDAVMLLLEAGADVHAFPPGIHEGGGPLHLAAMYGSDLAVEVLLDAGADPAVPDPQHDSDAAGWARHGGFDELGDRLDSLTG